MVLLMKAPLSRFVLVLSVALAAASLRAANAEPVTPNALPETRALLQLLYDLSGKHMLTGQHNYPNIKDRNSRFAADFTGKHPAVFSIDMGHAQAGNTDSYLARPDIVQEAIRQHRMGALVSICWHAVPPTADEPITFSRQPDSDPARLTSVQGQLLDEQFRDVLTPGTALHTKWTQQVDTIAVFLKQLEEARVPVLWRPYHEMNGDWFWWGGRTGEYSTKRLWRQIFDRYVHHHKLKNLVWVWNVDRPSRPGMEHELYFPGSEYLDVVSFDVYGNDFAQSYYNGLVKLAAGKPLALAEVGNPPSLEILDRQPLWTFYVVWAGMTRNTTRTDYERLFNDPRILNLEDPAYAAALSTYRQSINLPPVAFTPPPRSFSGLWTLDGNRTHIGRAGLSTLPAYIEIDQRGSELKTRSTRITEWGDNQHIEETLTLDGTETKADNRTARARLDASSNEIVIDSTVTLSWAPDNPITNHETWKLSPDGRELIITRRSTSRQGNQIVTSVYTKSL